MPRPIGVIRFYSDFKLHTVTRAEEYRPFEPARFGDPPVREPGISGASKDGPQVNPRDKLNGYYG
jgi:hypothetical protein